jgi:hypothetical protein
MSLRSSVLKVAELQDANAIDSNANMAARAPRRREPQGPKLPTFANSSANLLYWECFGARTPPILKPPRRHS